MVDTNSPKIDVRSTVLGGQPQVRPWSSPETDKGATEAAEPAAEATEPAAEATGLNQKETAGATGIATEVPAEYKASSYAELIPQLEKRMNEFKPMSEEELKKLRRRQKAEGIISGISDAAQSVANLIFTHHYAPNMYDAKEGMSAKAKARFEKEKKEREDAEDKWLNYALTIGKMKDADKDRGLSAWKIEQTLARDDRQYDADRADRKNDEDYRDKKFETEKDHWDRTFAREGEWHKEENEHWEKEFEFAKHKFKVSSAHEAARINLAARELANSEKKNRMTFNLGQGKGNVSVSLDKLNTQTVSRIFSTLPPMMQRTAYTKSSKKDSYGRIVEVDEPPTTETMLIAIGTYVDKSPATQTAIRELAGKASGTKMPGIK